MKKSLFVLTVSLFFFAPNAFSQRVVYSINDSWQFSKGDFPLCVNDGFDDGKWESVNIPHTWNKSDAMDDLPGYYRGLNWYRRTVTIPLEKKDKQLTIFFEAVNQEVELFVNAKSVGKHLGGYTRFSFDITPFILFGKKNTFAVKVDNSFNENIPPLTADFTFFGGIYRDVYLIYTSKQHISTTHFASSGVYITTPVVSEKKADISIKTILTNTEMSDKKIRLEQTIISPEKKIISINSITYLLHKFSKQVEFIQTLKINNPTLWSPDSPVLYSVITRLYDSKTNILLDETSNPLGFRWFEFSPEKGFILNGKPCKLMGTNRHQCFEGLGNALPDEIHVRDIKLLKDMGANFLRVAHYPQDPTIMEMCDKFGIITSIEIPIVNTITVNEQFTKNCLQMAREMVMQDFNHPSVLIWAYMNEVLLKIPDNSNSVKKADYLSKVGELALKIDNQLRADDAYRYTMIPMHANFDDYDKAKLTQIPMIVGWNMYQGWYGGKIGDFEVVLDNFHSKLKDKPVIVTEYGADVDPRLHSFTPVRFDYTTEYANQLHEHYSKAIKERKYISGAAIWNLNDFYSEERENSVPHVNSKGITTQNRELKDSYLFYQAVLLTRHVVLIGSSNWNIRGGIADSNYVCKQAMKVYSNLQEIELIVNGKSIGKKPVTENTAQFVVPFKNGTNSIEAFGKNAQNEMVCDFKKIDFRMIPSNLKDKILPFSELNVMLGSNRFFEDEINNVIWIPEKEYSPGSWGYIGGTPYQKKTKYAQQPASDLDIYNTNIDPVFQTMRSGLKSFKLDVPDGKYTISFYWAELESAKERKVSVYNLGNDAVADNFTKRIFDVSINNVKVKNKLNISEEFGERTAIIIKSVVDVNSGDGLNIEFEPIVGKTMLNAIRIYRNY